MSSLRTFTCQNHIHPPGHILSATSSLRSLLMSQLVVLCPSPEQPRADNVPGVIEWWACPVSASSLGPGVWWGQWLCLSHVFTPALNTNPGVLQMLSVEMNCPMNKQKWCNNSVGKIMARSPYITVPVPHLEIMMFCLATKQLNVTQGRKGSLTERLAFDFKYLVCTSE